MTHIMAQRGAVLICLTVTMGLAGCAGDSGGDQTSTTSPSAPAQSTDTTAKETGPSTPTPVETETPIAPVMPPAMANGDEAGARAAADYVLELYTYTYWSGDTGPLKAFCDPDSTFCANVVEGVSSQVASDQRYVGGEVSWIGDPTLTPEDVDFTAFGVKGVAHETSNSVIAADGTLVEEHPEVDLELDIIVYFKDDLWRFYDMTSKSGKAGES